MKTYTTAPQITAADVLRTLLQFLTFAALYVWQTVRNACRMAQKLARACATWLHTRHNFTPGETDPAEILTLTGWQFIIFLFCASLFMAVASAI